MECFLSQIGKRLAQCRTRRMRAKTEEEAGRLLAEEEGLIDAVLDRDRLEMYGPDQPTRRESYEIGFLDGIVIMSLQLRNPARSSLVRNLKQWFGCA